MTRLNNKGVALVMNLVVIAIFALLGTVVYGVARYQIREVLYQQRLEQSRYIAAAGLEDGLYQVFLNTAWRAGFNQKPFANGYYTVKLSTENPPMVTATGYSPYLPFVGRVATTLSARAAITYTGGNVYGLYAQTLAQINGPARVNAYSPAQSVTPSTFSFGGGVWSNSNVTTTAGALVNGGVSYTNTASIAANTVVGSVVKSAAVTLPNHTCGGCKTKNDNATGLTAACYNSGTKALTVSAGQTCSMKAGTYYFSNITVNGTLNVDTSTDAATIYFNGVVTLGAAGAVNSVSKLPSRLLFYGEQSGNTHTIASPTPLHAYFEERSASWNITGPLYGRVWGNNVTVSGVNGAVHVDADNATTPVRVTWEKTTWSQGHARQ